MTFDISKLLSALWTYIWLNLLRPVIKGFLRRTTGLCELQRICYATHGPSSQRCTQLEKSLILSRSPVIQRVRHRLICSNDEVKNDRNGVYDSCRYERLSNSESVSSESSLNSFQENEVLTVEEQAQLIEYAVDAICLDKRVKSSIHKEFVFSLRVSLTQMFDYKLVVEEAERLRKRTFDKESKDDCQLLVQLWNNLKPKNKIKVIEDCPDWSIIGFQQPKDPSTDFRGMGLLGLMQLVFLSKSYTLASHSMLSASNHPVNGYPFAITGINMSHLVLSLMKDGTLKNHFYNRNTALNTPFFSLTDFHKVYSVVFMAFNRFWIKENPRDVMEFSIVREKFVMWLTDYLNQETSDLFNDSFVLKHCNQPFVCNDSDDYI